MNENENDGMLDVFDALNSMVMTVVLTQFEEACKKVCALGALIDGDVEDVGLHAMNSLLERLDADKRFGLFYLHVDGRIETDRERSMQYAEVTGKPAAPSLVLLPTTPETLRNEWNELFNMAFERYDVETGERVKKNPLEVLANMNTIMAGGKGMFVKDNGRDQYDDPTGGMFV